MIYRSVIKRYTETIELLVILVNLGRRAVTKKYLMNLCLFYNIFQMGLKLIFIYSVIEYNYNEEEL